MELSEILSKYAVPDPKIVGKLPKGGTQLDFVGHADITRLLLEIDPTWRWVPIEWKDGRPAIHVENGMATMWGELTLLGQARLGVGSVRADKVDLDKELVGDFLRNAAMRFGICLSLWTKQEWEDLGETPKKPARPLGSAAKPSPVVTTRATGEEQQRTPASSDELLSPKQREDFEKACKDKGFSTIMVAQRAGLKWDNSVKVSDLPALRAAWHDFKNEKAETE
jgi:hypothetical protein